MIALRMLLAAGVLFAVHAFAQCEVWVPALTTGHYDSNGFHNSLDTSYLAGNTTNAAGSLRNFAVFQLPEFHGVLQAAQLVSRVGEVRTTSSNGLFTLFTLTNWPPDVISNHNTARWIYEDLGNSTVAGTFVFSTNYGPYDSIGINLSTDVLPLINAAAGTPWRYFALGGAVTDLNGQPGNIGSVFGNSPGGISNSVHLVLYFSPLISTQPSSQSIPIDSWAYFHADGCADTWQWYHHNQPVTGESNNWHYFHADSTNDAGSYYVVAQSGGIRVTSDIVTLTLEAAPPVFTTQPESVNALRGDWVWLEAYANGAPVPDYQWYFNGSPIPGATSYYLYVPTVAFTNQGSYFVVASNAYGSATSAVATITVSMIVLDYLSYAGTVLIGDSIYINASVRWFDDAPRFQWRFNGVPIPDATNSWLNIPNAQTNHAGGYDLIASNAFNVVTSATANISVIAQPPYFTSTLYDRTEYAGNTVTLYSYASAGPPADYQWFFNNAPLANETNYSLTLPNVATNQSGLYHVIASNSIGTATSRVAQITITYIAPSAYLTAYPAPTVEGGAARIAGSVWGAPLPSYQWLFNGQPIPGETNRSMLLLNLSTNAAGGYSLLASNIAGTATSAVAQVVVRTRTTLDRWEWRNPHPQGNDLYAAASGQGRCLAVGSGTLVSTTNGLDWESIHLPSFEFRHVAFGNGLFVAAATYSDGSYPQPVIVFTSTNAVHWMARELPPLYFLNSLSFHNGRFMLAGSFANVGGGFSTSTNGQDWTAPTAAFASGARSIAAGSNLLVAIESDYSFTSTDGGTNWSTYSSLPLHASAVTFGAGRFVVAGSGAVASSSDGVNWLTHDAGSYPLHAITYFNDCFVAGGYSQITTSPDGTNWTAQVVLTGRYIFAFATLGDTLFAFGEGGVTLRSTNGTAWDPAYADSMDDLYGITHGQNQFVVAGHDGTLLTSSNTIDWVRRDSGTEANLHDVAFGDGKFVAVGKKGTLLTSTDAVTWNVSTNTRNYLERVLYANGLWIVVGDNATLLTSTDAVTWTRQTPPASLPSYTDIEGVAFGNGLFIAVGGYFDNNASSIVLTSPDGTNWTQMYYDWGVRLRGIYFGNGIFVGTGNDGLVIRSVPSLTNVLGWTHDWLPTINLRNGTFGGGRFLVVGNDNKVFSSVDGTSWAPHPVPTSANLHAAAFADNAFVTVGNQGVILQAGPLQAEIERGVSHGPQGFVFHLRGGADESYRLQCSPDLLHWTNLLDFPASAGRLSVTNNPAATRQFYRIVTP